MGVGALIRCYFFTYGYYIIFPQGRQREIEQMFLFAQAATERKNSVAAFSWKYHSLCHSVLTVSHEPFDLKIFVETSQGSFFALFMLIIIFVTIF